MARVADYVAEYIYRLGVRDVFMVSGGGLMFLSDGIACHPHLKAVCTHHEQAAAMAAISYARYNENLGVAYVTTGCGGTNTITGLLGAWQDSTPCLFISGQSKRKETIRNAGIPLRQFGVQEADIVTIVASLTKYAAMVNDPLDIGYHLDKALYLAKSGRPGPVWLDIPLDVQGAELPDHGLRHFSPDECTTSIKMIPEDVEIERVAALLRLSHRPMIIAGQGLRLSRAIPQFRAFIEKHQIPFVVSRLGIDCLPSAHPLYVGRIGNKGDRAGNFAVQNADLVLAIGSRLSVSSTGHEYAAFAREAKIVVVDIDPIEHRKKTFRIDLLIEADAARFLELLTRSLEKIDTHSWVEKCRYWKAKWPVCLPGYGGKGPVNLYHFVDALSRQMQPGAVVVSDAGSSFYVCSQALQLKEGQRYITSGAQADMGYSLPATIGVSVARNKGGVIGVTGDGSLQMNIQEFQTVVHYDLPIKLFVWNNDGYLSIRATQTKFFKGRLIGTDKTSGVSFPNLERIVNAYGIHYVRIADNLETEDRIREVLDYPGAVVCEAMCDRNQEIIPSVASHKKPDGTMVSRPLEDMYPFLDREEFGREMIVPPIKEDPL